MVFSCTKKVRNLFKNEQTFDSEGEPIGIHNWYTNEISLDRKKFLLFTNSLTLFSFLVKAGTSKERMQMEQSFEAKLREMIIREISTSDIILNKILPTPLEYRYTKTSDKSVLGSMNDIMQQLKHYIHFEDSDDRTRNLRNINHCPYKALGYHKPVEKMRVALGALRIVK